MYTTVTSRRERRRRGTNRSRGRSREANQNRSNRVKVEPLQLQQWKSIQQNLKLSLIQNDDFVFGDVYLIGGLDISFFKNDKDRAIVCLSVFSYPNLQHIIDVTHDVKLTAPYVPGYLAFREVEHYLAVLNDLKRSHPDLVPDLMMVDGNGILHYGGLGSASHFGVLSGIPTIGVAKKLLCVDGLSEDNVMHTAGTILKNPGDYFYLDGKRYGRLGACMITADGELPIYISIGHRISLETCINVVAHCLQNDHREPTPTLHADQVGRSRVKEEIEKQRRRKHQRTPINRNRGRAPASRGRGIPIRRPIRQNVWSKR